MTEEREKYVDEYYWWLIRGLVPGLILASITTITVKGEPPTLLHGIFIRFEIIYYIVSISFGWATIRNLEKVFYQRLFRAKPKSEIDPHKLARRLFLKIVIMVFVWPLYVAKYIIFWIIAGIPGMILFPVHTIRFFRRLKKK